MTQQLVLAPVLVEEMMQKQESFLAAGSEKQLAGKPVAAQEKARHKLMLQSQARRQEQQPFRHWSKWKAAESSR